MATYYISNTGSNSNNGTSEATPWQTISKLTSSPPVAGDTVLFKRGDMWRETLFFPSSGSAGNYITYGAYGTGDKPIINGTDITTGWTDNGSNQWWINNPHPVTTVTVVVMDGVLFSEVHSLAEVNTPNVYFIDTSTTPDRIYIYSTVDPGTVTTEVAKREFGFVCLDSQQRHHLYIRDIEFKCCGQGGVVFYSNDVDYDGQCVVDNCTFYANRLWACVAQHKHNNNVFKNCDGSYNGNGFYAWVADGITIQDCTHSNAVYHSNLGFTDGGGMQGYQSDNIIIERCVSNDDYDAIHIDAGDVAIHGIMRYNKVYNSRHGSPDTPCMGVGNLAAGGLLEVYYNILINGANSAFECWNTCEGDVRVYNNTMYSSTSDSTTAVVYLVDGSNFDFKNNLIIRDYVGGEYSFMNVGATVATLDYNNYFFLNHGANEVMRNFLVSTSYFTIPTWNTATSQDAHSISVDPLFTNIATLDFTLQESSPARGAGINVGLTQDIDGNPVSGSPDMGAYQYYIPPVGISMKGRKLVVQ